MKKNPHMVIDLDACIGALKIKSNKGHVPWEQWQRGSCRDAIYINLREFFKDGYQIYVAQLILFLLYVFLEKQVHYFNN